MITMFPELVIIDGEPAHGKHYVGVRLSKKEYALPDALKEFYDFVRV